MAGATLSMGGGVPRAASYQNSAPPHTFSSPRLPHGVARRHTLINEESKMKLSKSNTPAQIAKALDELDFKAGTQFERHGQIIADLSLLKGWEADDFKNNKSEAKKFCIEVIEARGLPANGTNVGRLMNPGHPLVRRKFKTAMTKCNEAFALHPRAVKVNVQEAVVTRLKENPKITVAQIATAAKKEAKASHDKKVAGSTHEARRKTKTEALKYINQKLLNELVRVYGKDLGNQTYGRLQLKATDLPTVPKAKAKK